MRNSISLQIVSWRSSLVALAAAVIVSSCSSEKTAEKPSPSQGDTAPKITAGNDRKPLDDSTKNIEIKYQPTGISWDLNTPPDTVAGVVFHPASQWHDLGPSGDKKAFFTYDPVLGDTIGAQLSVYYFGSGGRPWQDIMERWINQMSYPGGRDPHTAAIRHDRVVGGMTAHVTSMLGTYHPPTEGFDREQAPVQNGHRLLGVAVEGPQGDVFFKLTGPDSTARVMIEPFMNMIYRLKAVE